MFLPLSTIAVSTTPAKKKETEYINQQRDVPNSRANLASQVFFFSIN